MTTHPAAKTAKHSHASTTSATNDPNQESDTMTTGSPKTTHAHTTTTATTTSPELAALVDHLTTQLDAAEQQMGAPPAATTAKAKQRRGKPRKGAEKALAQLAPIVKQYGLDSPSLNSDTMLSLHQTAQTLVPLQTRLTKMAKRVDDHVFDASTNAWDMGLQFYSLLQRRAKTDGSVATAIEPIAQSFQYRNPKTKEGKQSKVQTRVKARLKKTVALAQKHGVSVTVGPDGEATSIAGPPQAVQAAQAEMAATQASAPVAAAAPAAVAPAVTVTPAAVPVNGAAHS
jgi:hypothetical protein